MKKALLVYPEFSPFGFWNYKDVCRMLGAKYPAAPLGLITLAALLPREWDIRLIDMNTRHLLDSDIDWADLVFIGGMLSQQVNFLKLIDRVHARGKKVVAGGPDPSSQPGIYRDADYLVLGEAEDTIKPFLHDLKNGTEKRIYSPGEERPDITRSPVPRYDLLKFDDYLMIGVQFSRGCPFNCEFCDVIELYGRTPRTKTTEQIMTELDVLYRLGYRGHIDFVDDNFIGHKSRAKEILRTIKSWLETHNHPFYFSTESSINVADDDDLMNLMEDIDMRYLFVGIESFDDETLRSSGKKQNLNRKLSDDLKKIYSHGMIVNGGFIVGFDNETSEKARAIADAIDRVSIGMPMVGLLYALPNTQLARRMKNEGRLFEDSGKLDQNQKDKIDQTTYGLNFITLRPRDEILNDFIFIMEKLYKKRSYFNRCLRLGKALTVRRKYKPSLKVKLKSARAFMKLIGKLGMKPSTSYYFWRNMILILLTRPSSVEDIANLMAMYIHFRKQTNHMLELMRENLAEASGENATEPILEPAREATS